MLKLYHNAISPNSRRIWIALLEKKLEFELISIKLDGEQLQPEFLKINPFHHVPVLIDDDLSLVESLAILDYLEAKYPNPSLLPDNPKDLAIVRMVENLTGNELLPRMSPLVNQMMGFPVSDLGQLEQAKQQAHTTLKYFENLLDDRPYFGSDRLTLADIVAGTIIPWLPAADVSLSSYPKITAWVERLTQRPSWTMTQPSPEVVAAFKTEMQFLIDSVSKS